MKTGDINGLLGGLAPQKPTFEASGIDNPQSASTASSADKVDISTSAGRESATAMAKETMQGFKSALVETLISKQKSSVTGSLYSLIETPVDSFINNRFASLTPETRSQFMDMFETMSHSAGGLAPENLINDVFGSQGGFTGMITNLGVKLNSVR